MSGGFVDRPASLTQDMQARRICDVILRVRINDRDRRIFKAGGGAMVQLTDEAKSQIEIEVRKILLSEDTSLRRAWTEEAKTYREFLQTQFRWITIGVSTLSVVGASLFVWLFGNNLSQTLMETRHQFEDARGQLDKILIDAKDDLEKTVDSKVVEYRIAQDLKSKVETMLEVEVGNQAEKATNTVIVPKISELASKTVGELADKKN
jgi:hypothetical protein